jgi:hypothetical protein
MPRSTGKSKSTKRSRPSAPRPSPDDYQVVIQWSEEDECYVATLPAWQNARTHGRRQTSTAPVRDRAAGGLRGGDMLAGPQGTAAGEACAGCVNGRGAGCSPDRVWPAEAPRPPTRLLASSGRDREYQRRYPIMSRRDARDQQVLRCARTSLALPAGAIPAPERRGATPPGIEPWAHGGNDMS